MRSLLSVVNGLALLTASVAAHPYEFRSPANSLTGLSRRAVSPDNTCGMTGAGANNGYTCPTGFKCCSQYGWCGNTVDHCGTGCQAAYGECGTTGTTSTTSTTSTTIASSTTPTSSTINTSSTTATNTSTAPTSTSTLPVSTDMSCGATAGTRCPSGYCCSQYGYCGLEPAYCAAENNCQSAYGECTGTGNPTVPTNGRCGPANGNQVCANNQCCSPEGYCGTTQYHCQSPDCLLGFGRCDADTVPSGASTYTNGTTRVKLGSIPYGADIYDCDTPNTLALTYDDGPYIYTNDVLDILATHNAKATFFVTGINNGKGEIDDESLPWPAMIRRMVAEGHQVASHTWSHADLSTLSDSAREAEMVKNEMAIRNIIGKYPTYMRPPYSSCNDDCMDTMLRLGYHVTYFDFDTQDYLHTTPETNQISKNVITSLLATPADNWLSIMHDIHEQTAHNLTSFFLESAAAKGFRFVTVGECLGDPEANWYRTGA